MISAIGMNPSLAAANPSTPPPAKKSESLGQKILDLPRDIVETAAGTVGGVVGTAYHILPGTFEGAAEGLTSDRGAGGSGWYTTTLLAESIGTGAAFGAAFGGPAGVALGAGIGLVGGAIYRFMEGHADVPQHFVQQVETHVDTAIANNTDGSKVKIAVQNMTQGAIIGTGIGAKEGWKVGYDAGKGTVSGVMDVAYGTAEGIWAALRHH